MKTTISIIAALVAATSIVRAEADYSSLQVPGQIQYQGRVASTAGDTWSGTQAYFCFAITEGSTILWNNWQGSTSPSDPEGVTLGAGQMLTLPVDHGVFSVRLGAGAPTNSPIPPGVFMNSTTNTVRSGVKLAVWFSPDGSAFTRLSPDVEFTSVPYAMVAGVAEAVKEGAVTQGMLAPTAAVPVGAVIAWWGSTSNIPSGFELCNGAVPTTAGATLAGNKPNLLGRFPRGSANADVKSSPITGGTDMRDATSTGPTALSIAQMPAHTHGITDPGHSHKLYAGGTASVNPAITNGSSNGAIYGPTASSVTNITINSSGSGQAHDHTIPSHDNRPAYLELLYIIRVK